MKKNGFFSERVSPVLVMVLFTVVCISLVSGIHLATLEQVAANEGLFLRKAVLYAAGIELPQDNSTVNTLFNERVKDEGDYFVISDASGADPVFAFIQKGPGLWGEIEAVMAFRPDGKTVAGIEFIKQNETPGLGARITELWFKEQLRGKRLPLRLVPEDSDAGPDEIEAITGASRTSESVLVIFNSAGETAGKIRGRM